MKKFNLGLSIAAGLLGGMISHFAWMPSVHAQIHVVAPKEIRAQSFVLVDENGKVQGVFCIDKPERGSPTIKLFNGQGQEIWGAGGNGMRLIDGSKGPK